MRKLSIITINRNNAEGLRKTMESVFSQTYCDFEYIIIDGASTDDSVNIIRGFTLQAEGLDVKWISEPDKGIYDAMNKGIEMATGEYCLFLNSGDVLANDNVIENWLQHDLKADIIACNAIFEKSRYQQEELIISPDDVKSQHLILSYLPHQATFIRRQLFKDIHLYDTSFRVVSDWLFFIEALLVHYASYQHINMFVARCETEGISNQPNSRTLIDDEFQRGLKKVLPLYYDVFAALRQQQRDKVQPFSQYMEQFSHSWGMRVLWWLRKQLDKWGYFRCKAKIKQHSFYKQLQREDDALKRINAKEIAVLPKNLLHRNNDASDIIVSLTSFGHRVADTVPFTLLSLFRQTRMPNRIVLWLDKEHWNDENLPPLLNRLKESGLEICYCEDFKSYKKLIPSLKKFPDNPIIVVDDDSYYDKDLVKWLAEAYEQSDKRTIFATVGAIPEKRTGRYAPYSEWKDDRYADEKTDIALTGCGGAIYPPHIFDEEILNNDVFMALCPTADDLWFWVQSKRMGISMRLTPKHGYHLLRPVDKIEDFDVHNSDNLTRINVVQGKNNQQLEALLEYYKLQ